MGGCDVEYPNWMIALLLASQWMIVLGVHWGHPIRPLAQVVSLTPVEAPAPITGQRRCCCPPAGGISTALWPNRHRDAVLPLQLTRTEQW